MSGKSKANEGLAIAVLIWIAMGVIQGSGVVPVLTCVAAAFWGLPIFWERVIKKTIDDWASRALLLVAAIVLFVAIIVWFL